MLDDEKTYRREDRLGEVEISVQWYHDPKADELAEKHMNIFTNILHTIGKMRYIADK